MDHALPWGLKSQGFTFELKGGTSLSKGFGIIKRFSEDIDIRFEPPAEMEVKTGKGLDNRVLDRFSADRGMETVNSLPAVVMEVSHDGN